MIVYRSFSFFILGLPVEHPFASKWSQRRAAKFWNTNFPQDYSWLEAFWDWLRKIGMIKVVR